MNNNLFNMKTETIIYSTMNYGYFKFIESNRPINRNNVENLKVSIMNKNLLCPVMVNEHGEIIDGQHRFIAWQELKLPIYFYIQEGTGEEEMIALNINKATWKPKDYLEYFVKTNKTPYIEFQNLKNKYGIQISDLLTIIDKLGMKKPIGENAMGRKFKEGSLDMSNREKVIKFIGDLQQFKESEHYLSTYFIRAFLRLYISDFYDSDFLTKRVNLSRTKIQNNKGGYTDEQCTFLADIYVSKRDNVLVMYDKGTKSFYKIRERSLK